MSMQLPSFQVRMLEPADALASSKLATVAFGMSRDVQALAQQFRTNICWGAFAEGTLCSQMAAIPFAIRFDGRWTPMCGIGGVATLPPYRRAGAVRKLFTHLFPVMRAAGQAFSVLFPFSYAYYRRFGYEAVYRYRRVTLPFTLLEKFPRHQAAHFYEPGESCAEFNALYECFTAGRQLALRRDADNWQQRLLPADPWKERKHAYLLNDADGNACAYFIFQPDESAGKCCMRIHDWAVRDAGSLPLLFGFLRTFGAHFETLEMTMPTGLLPELLFNELSQVQCGDGWSAMARLVDVEAALRLLRRPSAASRVVLRVVDDILAWNNDTFAITCGEQETAVSRVGEAADMTVDVRTLARLLLGTLGLDDPFAALLPGLEITARDPSGLRAMFPRKAMWMNDHF